jgi:hypothetical protein
MEKINLNWFKLTELNTQNINQIPDNTKGVYRLSYKHNDGNIYVFYVGETENMKIALLNILTESNNPCIESHKTSKCFYKYTVIDQSELSHKVLAKLYKFYQPNCNEPILSVDNEIEINVN